MSWWERPLATLNSLRMDGDEIPSGSGGPDRGERAALGEAIPSDEDENSGEVLNDEEVGPSTTMSTTSTSTSTPATCSMSTSLHKDTEIDVTGEEEKMS